MKKRLLTLLMVMALVFTSLSALGQPVKAAGTDILVPVNGEFSATVKPGKTTHVVVKMEATENVTDILTYGLNCDEELLTLSGLRITDNTAGSAADYTLYPTVSGEYGATNTLANAYGNNKTFLKNSIWSNGYAVYTVEFDVTANAALAIGDYTVKLTAVCDATPTATTTAVNKVELAQFEIVNNTAPEAIDFKISSFNYVKSSMKANSHTSFDFKLENVTALDAYKTYIIMDLPDGVEPDYDTERIELGTVAAAGKKDVSVPVFVTKDATPGKKTVVVNVYAVNKAGEATAFSQKFYVDINETATVTPAPLGEVDFAINGFTYDKNKMIADTHTGLSFVLANMGSADALKTYIVVDLPDGIEPDYDTERIELGTIAGAGTKEVTVPVHVTKDVTPGKKSVMVSVYAVNKDGVATELSQKYYIDVLETAKAPAEEEVFPELVLSTNVNFGVVARGEDITIPITVANNGAVEAKDVKIKCVAGLGAGSGLIRKYTSDTIDAGTVKACDSYTFAVPAVVAEDAIEGLHELAFEVTAVDEKGNEYAETITLYLVVPKLPEEAPTPTPTPEPVVRDYITIKNVSQSTSAPAAGEKVTISFDFVNQGTDAINKLRVYGTGLSSAGFEPISSEPYTSVGSVEQGETKRISLTFRCGENIASGVNTLTIGYEYFDVNDNPHVDSVTVYVLNVKSKEEEKVQIDVGRPKLIVNAYGSDVETIKAGDTFEFSFTLKNTHAIKAAKNIKITLSQAEGVFAPASGTNIFYIESIPAGEESTQTMSLKTRSDASTGDYAISLLVEYEYDDMSDVDKERGGVSEENNIKLRATENYRPVIENIYVETWDTIYVGNPVDLSFEFYNMGKSTLGNVYVTVEGDFELANNSKMSYIGAIGGYSQEFVNPQVVPLVSGQAIGTLVVHFEDSNGDEVTTSQEFSCYVEEMGGGMGWEGGFDDWGDWPIDDPGFYPEEPIDEGTSKQIFGMNMWLFIGICAAAVAVVVAVVVVVVVKSKKKAKDMDDEDY